MELDSVLLVTIFSYPLLQKLCKKKKKKKKKNVGSVTAISRGLVVLPPHETQFLSR